MALNVKNGSVLTPLNRPFLKWPGGKFRLVEKLKTHIPAGKYLIEPFVGAGAVFSNMNHPQVVLNDINADLINIYRQLQLSPKEFITGAQKLFTTKNNQASTYYRLRTRFNSSNDPIEKSILFLYLNRHGYNGLCRYNLDGRYNVPFGAYKQPYFPLKELENFASLLKNASLSCLDYNALLTSYLKQENLERHVFYCDPPYAPISHTANFTGYAACRFTLEDQVKLADLARALAKKGATVVMSNHDTAFTRKIYHGAKLHKIRVQRNISCVARKRAKVAEIMACFGAAN